ncbi:MAG: PspC domain-containing protein [Massilibacteroides sp.]|nr:PspC domain-containing protein [Massilibacteroides sp.]MDD3063010.1 PspC domain-containing protein [Massilibacteroides sp.]MDD4114956.1 PspC domain-containing protein [Massilibacteroides sp.]MDD4661575.1 PspC domain-containing protein [Massilibacteroides sp.]
MKKTLTINLGGTVFHIDEDAYQLLDKYLSNLRIHFKKEEGSDEIMNDFEMRISELFGERVRLGYEVITVVEVEDVIKRMGKPEELFDAEASESKSFEQSGTKERQTVQKRLFRNPDDRILGGVAGGLAAYLGWDPSAIRIALFVLMFLYGVTIPIYIILWIIIPEAKTATEKLQMSGKSVTIENIGKTVTDGFEKVSENVNNYISSDKPRTLFQKILDVFVAVVGGLLKIILILLAIILFPPLLLVIFVLIIVLFALVFGGGVGVLYSILPNIHWHTFDMFPENVLIWAGISTVLMIVIPIIVIVYMILSQLFKFKPVANSLKWTLLIIWIVAVVANIIFAARFGLPFWGDWSHWSWDTTWQQIQMLL